MFEVGRLRLLREFTLRKTMTAVGKAIGQTSSAVSQQLAILEREAGVQLFERMGRRVRLTDAGIRLAGHASTILHAVEIAHLDMKVAADRPPRPIVIACFAGFARTHLSQLMEQLRLADLSLMPVLLELEPPAAVTALLHADCEVVISHRYDLVPYASPNNVVARLLSDEPVLVVLSRRFEDLPDPIDVATLADENWVVGCGLDDELLVNAIGIQAGFEPRIAHRAKDYDLVQELVAADLGVGLVPCAELWSSDLIIVRSLTGPTPQRQIMALTRSSNKPAQDMDALFQALETALTEMSRSHP